MGTTGPTSPVGEDPLPMKPLDDFDVECMVRMLGRDCADFDMDDLPSATTKRVKSRLKRFVLSHPLVTPEHARIFRKAMAGKDDSE